MRKRSNIIVAIICILSFNMAFGQAASNQLPEDNPFKYKSKLSYQAIPFDKIKDEHYRPALIEGLRQQLEEVNAIANNTAAPTFENTIAALELSGELLNRASAAFGSQTSANTNAVLQKLREEMAPRMAATSNEIYLNPKLFARIQKVYNNRSSLHLDDESKALLELTYQRFVMSGAKLSGASKDQIKS
jgi:peptidyl-dipeptidase Dcp